MASGFSGPKFQEAAKAALAYRPSHLKTKVLLFLEAFILHHQGIISGQYIELQAFVETNKNAKAVINALTNLQDVRVVAKKRGKTPKTLFEI